MGAEWPRYAEFVLWVVVAAALVSVLAGLVGYAVGDSLVSAKYALFVVGTLLFGFGSFAIQPTPTYKEQKRISFDGSRENRFESFVQRLPPLRHRHVPFDRRVNRNVKLFVTSLVVLGVSLVMEFWFEIRV